MEEDKKNIAYMRKGMKFLISLNELISTHPESRSLNTLGISSGLQKDVFEELK